MCHRPELATLAASPVAWAAVAGLGLTALAVKSLFDKGSRKYDGNVGAEYDAWTSEGILEYYWGEHIHLGVYNEAERAAGYRKKNFKQVCGAGIGGCNLLIRGNLFGCVFICLRVQEAEEMQV